MALSSIKVNNSPVTSVDNEPILNSLNLITSGAVAEIKTEALEETLEENRQMVNSIIEDYAPVEITGDVNNAADEEDLTSVNVSGTNVLKFKDKVYNSIVYSGLGKVILRKNMVNNVNTLTLSMINTANTIYVIQYDFTIGEDITVPANCVLEFEGGSISDNGTHTLTGTNTLLSGDIKCLVTIAGTFANDYLDITWFGAVGDDNTDCASIFRNVFDTCVTSGIDMYVPEGTFAFKVGRFDPSGQYDAGEDTSKYLDCKDVTIYGIYKKSIIKSYNNGDVLNISWTKNLNLKNLTVTSGYTPTGTETLGANLISLIDVENITIDGCYCHDSFWYWRDSSDGYYADGGDGITLQGKVFHNVKITNCEIYNCDIGLDVNMKRGDFTYNPNSGIYISNVLVTKCYFGLHYGHYDYQEDHSFDVRAGLSYIQMKCVNCFKSCYFYYPVGVKAYIQTVATETIEQRLLSSYGTSWYGDIPTTSIPKDVKSSSECNIIGAVNCNIEVNSSAKEINYGFVINPGGTRGTSHNYLFLNSIISLTLSENATVVPVKDQTSITDEAKFKYEVYNDYNGPADKCVFIFNNLTSIDTFNDFMMYYTLSNNNIFIIDGKVLTRAITTGELRAYTFDDVHNVAGKLITRNGIWVARNKISSDNTYPVFAIDNEDILKIGFNGEGDIVRDTITAQNHAGGQAISVRLFSDNSSVVGAIPVYKGYTKGTTTNRPILSSDNAGQCYFDTTLNKPIWWNGTEWVDATGTQV